MSANPVPPRLPRLYEAILDRHLGRYRQMAFVAGPRQVGKTTTCRGFATEGAYLNWDDPEHRRDVVRGPRAVAERIGLERLREEPVVVVFDEIHKFARWKTFIKGFFDLYATKTRAVLTGSSRLDVYRRGGDSLMGRYFSYRMHPLSVGELLRPRPLAAEIAPPEAIEEERFSALWEHGGYPEPFLLEDPQFSRRWRDLRRDLLVREEVRDLTRIHELGQLEVLVQFLLAQSGSHLVYSNLAREVSVSVDTARRWVAALSSLYLGFLVRPWFRNVSKSLRKEPKWFCLDWSMLSDPGPRAETFVACHLLKAAQTWQDLGFGTFELRYLRDKDKREVDFLVVRDRKPWFLVEVKVSDTSLSPALGHFQRQVGADHAFQAVLHMEPVSVSCFERRDPCVVPLKTLLSQLP